MQVCVNSETRVIVQLGDALQPRDGCVIEDVSSETASRVLTALGGRQGGVVLGSDHQIVTLLPVPQEVLDAEAAAEAEAAANAAAENQDTNDRAQLAAIDDSLSSFIALQSPSNAQVLAAVRGLARLCRYIIRRGVRQGWL